MEHGEFQMTPIFDFHASIESFPLFALYLDPGTGGLLYSLITGLFAASYFFLKSLFFNLKSKFLGSNKSVGNINQKIRDIVLVSEGNSYFGTFMPLVKELSNRTIYATYITMDEKDRMLEFESDYVDVLYIGKGYAAWRFLNTMKADMVISTTPGLNVLQIKRSPEVKHYMHLVHAPTDKSYNKTYSFDYFDSVIVNGIHQVRVLRELERIRGLKQKELLILGCVYYDYLQQKTKEGDHSVNCVLVAPTWGRNGLLSKYGAEILIPLLERGLNVVVRPHPQSVLVEKALLEELEEELKGFDNLKWDFSSDLIGSINQASILISDISGIVFDFAFLLERPVITVKSESDRRGTEGFDLSFPAWEETILDEIGYSIEANQISSLPDFVQRLSNVGPEVVSRIREIKKEKVVNFGCAAEPVIDFIESKLHELRML